MARVQDTVAADPEFADHVSMSFAISKHATMGQPRRGVEIREGH